MDDGDAVLGLFAVLLLAIPLIIAGAIAYLCIKVVICIGTAIKDAIVNSPLWEEFQAEERRQVGLQQLAETEDTAVRLIEGSAQYAAQRFEQQVEAARRTRPREVVRRKA